ncbi:ekc/keops complex subunit tp53rk [Quercus suber]|uniref:non-specific serine/threonine protein kinase n=2 Tax=Quercus suber TaxID=58331 RepID=A0AAW0M9I6_QUESU
MGLDACGLVLAAKIGACESMGMSFDACGLVLAGEIDACGSMESMLEDFDSFESWCCGLSIMEIKTDVKESSLILLKQGAEARVFESNFVGKRSVIKERFSKKYRHPTLDSKITLKRLNAEARCMTKARRLGVSTPVLYSVDPVLHTLTFEYVDGPSVKDILLEFGSHGIIEEQLDDIALQIGDAIGKLHDGGLIHGDLTTSNMLLKSGTNQLVLIDFGLSFTSTLPEDKAVDLYVLERALLSMHSSCGNVMDRVLAAYQKSSKQWSSTLNKLAQVRQRGRKRTMVG